ncbi:probable protein S-acyltransferase 15 isoform X2 [Rhodamnia argentea]|uniref:S-acyltransferase n=1 Tax=Rhodamnia argentea TaxID=178133 RepID=A0A8B8QRL9_9MYRT|nr:probable protein S-acyltransferase 15 isoform X2 [Rhodamnia argentea]
MKWERLLSIPILAVFLLMGFVYYTTLFVSIEDWVGLQSSGGSFHALAFTFLASYSLFSFFVCVLTDPGHVPSSYVPDVEDRELSDQEFRRNVTHQRKCEICSTYKPRRCHHCRTCRRCVLRMDHHCRWINNCVGYWNYKAFFILVLVATVASIYSTILFIACARQKDWEVWGQSHFKALYVTCGISVLGLSITLGSLLCWHIYLMANNMTTIEYYEAVRARWLARKSGQSYRHPFNLGVYRNVTSVLGPNMLKWLLPTAVSHLKDGISFRIAHDTRQTA